MADPVSFRHYCSLYLVGVVAVWKFVGHDGCIIAAVIIPLVILGIILSLAAFTATRRSTRDFVDAALSLIYFWG